MSITTACVPTRCRSSLASAHCFFSVFTRRIKTLHGHHWPEARPLSWSALTVASPRCVWLSGLPPLNLMYGPVRVQSSDSPFTKPSKDAVPLVPCASPFTFAPFCSSPHRTERSAPVVKDMEPSHVPVTPTGDVETRLGRSPPAHPRLESASRIRIVVPMKNRLNSPRVAMACARRRRCRAYSAAAEPSPEPHCAAHVDGAILRGCYTHNSGNYWNSTL